VTEARTPPTFCLIDGTSNIFRAFYAIRGLSSPSGRPTNATYGFTQMLRKLLQERAPEYLAVVFDRSEPTHRHVSYPQYKANRMAPPEDLVEQIPDVREACRVLGVPVIDLAGYEADDLMATLARKASSEGFEVILVSSDKDLLQLVGPHITVFHPSKGEILDREGVKRSFGVYPEQVVDVLALMGDSSDNVPGVPGIGEKGARDLITQYGGLENCLSHAAEIAKKTHREALQGHAAEARLSRDLVTLRTDVPVPWVAEDFRRRPILREEARALYQKLGFSRLLEELAAGDEPAEGVPAASAPADPIFAPVPDRRALGEMVRSLSGAKSLAVAPELSEEQPMRACLTGIALSASAESGFYIRLSDEPGELGIGEPQMVQALAELLRTSGAGVLCENLKSLEIILRRWGIPFTQGDLDSTLAAYLVDSEARDYRLPRLEESMLGIPAPPPAPAEAGESPPGEGVFAARRCRALVNLERPLKQRLEDLGLEKLYRDLELPLTSVLASMELTGVRIDAEFLRGLSKRWNEDLRTQETRVHELAGGPFNIQSPRQLGEILFNKLGLTPGRKTEKERVFSTGVDVLESLASSHPLPAAVLEYRRLSKLLSTYVDALPSLVNPQTGRVHTSFNQTAAATGRLSSSDPNLQNIPIRTEQGREIRRAFVAEPGWSVLSADYSQIELRVLAHLSQDPEMIRAFRAHEDIHRRTAAQVFGVAPELVTAGMRNQAKAINFGILYGMGSFRLSRQLGVPLAEAKKIIEEYFRRFEGVRRYRDGVIETAERTGRVSTMFGRIRNVPEIRSRNMNQRNLGIRVAVNTTVQGSAADLIKVAMIALHAKLQQRALRARLLIQVHDELVVEAPAEELGQAGALMRECMETSTCLDVPLLAEVRSGPTWLDTK
jgi:DNA polymerase-1